MFYCVKFYGMLKLHQIAAYKWFFNDTFIFSLLHCCNKDSLFLHKYWTSVYAFKDFIQIMQQKESVLHLAMNNTHVLFVVI